MKNRISGATAVFLSALLMALFCSAYISAAEAPSLTLHYEIDSAPIENVAVKIYKVANYTEAEGFELTGGFEDHSIEPNVSQTTEAWDILAETLSSGVLSDDGIKPILTAVSDSDGTVRFDNIEEGMYLVLSGVASFDGKTVKFAPALVASVNIRNGETGNISVYPKGGIYKPSYDTVTYKVVKLWNDQGSDSRPESIEIAVICNGKAVQQRTLSADNDWTYTWTSLDDGSVWSATEINAPDGYTVTVENKNGVFIITNTKTPGNDSPAPPPQTSQTPPQTGDTGSKYVLVMACSGLCSILLGLALRKRKES